MLLSGEFESRKTTMEFKVPNLKSQLRWPPIVMTGVALILVLATGIWGMLRDLDQVADSITQADMAKFRSHADRTVSRIESEVRETRDLIGFVKRNPRWFEELWIATVRRMPEVLYGAVLDVNKLPIDDSDRLIVDDENSGDVATLIALPQDPQGDQVPGLPSNSILLSATPQTNNKQVLDVTYPIRAGSQVLGYYRTGMDYDLLQGKILQARRKAVGGWAVMLLSITAIVVGACISLYRWGLHTIRLEHQLNVAEIRRVDELHRLIVGLAHEVRNPLNAIRLNLFASKKILQSG